MLGCCIHFSVRLTLVSAVAPVEHACRSRPPSRFSSCRWHLMSREQVSRQDARRKRGSDRASFCQATPFPVLCLLFPGAFIFHQRCLLISRLAFFLAKIAAFLGVLTWCQRWRFPLQGVGTPSNDRTALGLLPLNDRESVAVSGALNLRLENDFVAGGCCR